MKLIFCLIVVASSPALSSVIQEQSPQPHTFLRQQLGFTPAEFSALEKGDIVLRLPKTPETREVAAFAIMRLDVPANFFISRVRDIVSFKTSENVLQIGKFSNPPRLEDLAGLTFDQVDIDAIRRCRLNKCDVKLSANAIDRFRKEIDWSATNHRDRVTQLMREVLLEHLRAYLQGGDAALGEYRDKSYRLPLGAEFRTLLQPAPYMYGYVPEFQQYLQQFPYSTPADAESFVYWSKEKFGLKPVVSMTHILIYKRPQPHGTDLLIGSKGIYASHYFETSLGLTGFIHSQWLQPSRSYLIYINRSRTDALRGLFAGLKRSLISGSLRDGARTNMEMIKKKLETAYQTPAGELPLQ